MFAAIQGSGKVRLFVNREFIGFGRVSGIAHGIASIIPDQELFETVFKDDPVYLECLTHLGKEDAMKWATWAVSEVSGGHLVGGRWGNQPDRLPVEAVVDFNFRWGLVPDLFKDYPGYGSELTAE